jgi:hypothetical protein
MHARRSIDITAHKETILKRRLSVAFTHVTHRISAKRGRIHLSVPSIYLQLSEDREDVNIDAGYSLLTIQAYRSTLRLIYISIHLPYSLQRYRREARRVRAI